MPHTQTQRNSLARLTYAWVSCTVRHGSASFPLSFFSVHCIVFLDGPRPPAQVHLSPYFGANGGPLSVVNRVDGPNLLMEIHCRPVFFCLGLPVVPVLSPSSARSLPFLGWEGSPTKIDVLKKVGTLQPLSWRIFFFSRSNGRTAYLCRVKSVACARP